MKVHDLLDDEGRIFAIEVENFGLGRKGAVRIVRGIPGVTAIREQRADDFCEFEVGGVPFVIEEPDGNSSRYWVGPKSMAWVAQLAIVRAAFVHAVASH
jgi:hypothetical protein